MTFLRDQLALFLNPAQTVVCLGIWSWVIFIFSNYTISLRDLLWSFKYQLMVFRFAFTFLAVDLIYNYSLASPLGHKIGTSKLTFKTQF